MHDVATSSREEQGQVRKWEALHTWLAGDGRTAQGRAACTSERPRHGTGPVHGAACCPPADETWKSEASEWRGRYGEETEWDGTRVWRADLRRPQPLVDLGFVQGHGSGISRRICSCPPMPRRYTQLPAAPGRRVGCACFDGCAELDARAFRARAFHARAFRAAFRTPFASPLILDHLFFDGLGNLVGLFCGLERLARTNAQMHSCAL